MGGIRKIEPFENHLKEYEDWFEKNGWVYRSELAAVRERLPKKGDGVEIGVGSARFAEPLGINFGVEPSPKMRRLARQRGVEVIDGVAENLPFVDGRFDYALMVTTICFLSDIELAFKEVFRVLKPNGSFIIGFVDKNSPLGKIYQSKKEKSLFYKIATFYSVEEVLGVLEKAKFKKFSFTQTVFSGLDKVKEEETAIDGYGKGSFVVIKAEK